MKEDCPACTTKSTDVEVDNETWVECDACKRWYHARCVGIQQQVATIDQFHCPECEVTQGPSTLKPEQRKSNRSHERLNYAQLNEGTAAGDERIWKKLLQVKHFKKEEFKRYPACDVNLDLIRKTGMREPFIIEKNEPELDMKMPPADISVQQIAQLVGEDTLVDVIDVVSQTETTGWTLKKWADYFDTTDRDRIRNVISLEISESKLSEQITRPGIVRQLDWMDQMWPDEEPEYPKVQLYCLMGTKDSYTDFHIDFGGSSVFYHVLRGSKTFYFIEPTEKNLKKYQKWSSSADQSTTFLGDLVKECYSVDIKAGNTMIIPTGWIHAVFTPEDSVVIGGNFLHSFNVDTQLKVYKIEDETDVPLKFRFPYYKKMNWYAMINYDTYLTDSDKRKALSRYELESMIVLARFLREEVLRASHNGTTLTQSARKLHQIPESLEDPIALTERVKKQAKKLVKAMDLELLTELKKKAEETKGKNVIRLVLNVKNKDPVEKKYTPPPANDDYILEDEEEEEEEEDWKIEEDDDDDEYEEESETIVHNTVTPEKTVKKKTTSTTVKRKKRNDDSDSSDDEDSMGTKKSKSTKPVLFANRKRSLSNNSNSSQTAKQRIWGVINNKKF